MGLRFRKSINLGGGFRINLSKSGIGHSWGIKGFRVTKTAKGTRRTTTSIPGTGISYVHETGKKQKLSAPAHASHYYSTPNNQAEGKESQTTMTSEMNNSSYDNPQTPPPNKKAAIARWIIGGCFVMFALVNGFHYSSLFLLGAAFLMFPLPFVTSFLQERNIKPSIAIIIAVGLFLVGVFTAPPSESTDSLDTSAQTTIKVTEKETEKETDAIKEPDTTSVTQNPTTETEEKVKMVWVAASGTKYHSKSTCSNMKSPRQISLEEAQNQGYTPCQKCH